jgi:glycosyltransferase involved in cell wall biosynthesis
MEKKNLGKVRFSVIIPALNEEMFLPHLLDSLTDQTVKDFEVIVVDGSSKDRTVEITKSYKNQIPELSAIVSPKACLPLQRNLGAKKAQGEWLVFIDADTVLMPYFFERVGLFIDKNHPELVTTWFRPDTEVNNDAVTTLIANLTIEWAFMTKHPLSPGPMTMVTRRAYDAVGGYDEAHVFHEDMDFSLRLHKIGVVVAIIKETLYVWSLRRLRQQGTLKVLQQYAKSAMPILFFNKTLTHMPGYEMGGQLYKHKKVPQKSKLHEYELKLKKLMKELFT